jgi:hypothetical protein
VTAVPGEVPASAGEVDRSLRGVRLGNGSDEDGVAEQVLVLLADGDGIVRGAIVKTCG